MNRQLAAGTVAVIALLAAASGGVGLGGTRATQTLHAVDARLCPFTLDVTVRRQLELRRVGGTSVQVVGPSRITLRNVATGRTAALEASGTSSLARATGSIRFSGQQVWLGDENHVPYLATTGKGSVLAPDLALSGGGRARVIDPCALVAPSPPSTRPAATPAPWGLPAYALSRIGYAGLTPLVGRPRRHDHMHLDLIVEGRRITIPAGLGQAEPVDRGPGPCPPPPESRTIGDCAPGRYFTAEVAASPLQTHSTSGILHLQAERPGSLTLGQFFDQWGVRFDSSCLGGHCTGGGKELRVFVNGKRLRGDPRKLVLLDQQVIAVVFGGPGAFRSVPSTYPLRWPTGCGGPAERSCFP